MQYSSVSLATRINLSSLSIYFTHMHCSLIWNVCCFFLHTPMENSLMYTVINFGIYSHYSCFLLLLLRACLTQMNNVFLWTRTSQKGDTILFGCVFCTSTGIFEVTFTCQKLVSTLPKSKISSDIAKIFIEIEKKIDTFLQMIKMWLKIIKNSASATNFWHTFRVICFHR